MSEAQGAGRGRGIVVLSGAGISAESGLPTFRGADGLWMGWRLEEVATPEAFARQPEVVQRFYDLRRRQLLAAEVAPNAAHRALAELERQWPGPVQIVTQNIDDLHERAGSRNLIHMHGELLKARCTGCAAVPGWREDLAVSHHCPACGSRDSLRPHVVWFGEMPLELDAIEQALAACDLFIAVGTRDRSIRLRASSRRSGATDGRTRSSSTSSPARSTAGSPSAATGRRARSFRATSMSCSPR
jgi:NAD-dependent deacetylase